jgi:hypothetical protein
VLSAVNLPVDLQGTLDSVRSCLVLIQIMFTFFSLAFFNCRVGVQSLVKIFYWGSTSMTTLECFSRGVALPDELLRVTSKATHPLGIPGPPPEDPSRNFFLGLPLDPPPPYPRFGIPVPPPP